MKDDIKHNSELFQKRDSVLIRINDRFPVSLIRINVHDKQEM